MGEGSIISTDPGKASTINEPRKVQGTVKLMKKVRLKPNQTLKVSGKGTHPLNSKRVNVIVEPIDEEYGEYAIPSYSFLRSNSK